MKKRYKEVVVTDFFDIDLYKYEKCPNLFDKVLEAIEKEFKKPSADDISQLLDLTTKEEFKFSKLMENIRNTNSKSAKISQAVNFALDINGIYDECTLETTDAGILIVRLRSEDSYSFKFSINLKEIEEGLTNDITDLSIYAVIKKVNEELTKEKK